MLGARTLELIHQNVHLEAVRTDVETLVLDAEVLSEILNDPDPAKRGREIEINMVARLRKHAGNPKFTELGERIVADIDDIVKKVRFPDWQRTNAGERLIQKELRRTLLKYKLHTDQELFDKAYGYIRQYY